MRVETRVWIDAESIHRQLEERADNKYTPGKRMGSGVGSAAEDARRNTQHVRFPISLCCRVMQFFRFDFLSLTGSIGTRGVVAFDNIIIFDHLSTLCFLFFLWRGPFFMLIYFVYLCLYF